MPPFNKVLRKPFHYLIDTLFSRHYVQEKLWQSGKDKFALSGPPPVSRASLSPLPVQYRQAARDQVFPTLAPPPVFITARFRSGSTFLWQLFKSIQGVTCYYEPLNEAAWFLLDKTTAPLDQTHIGVDDYRAEYDTCRAAAQSGTCHLHQVAMTMKAVPIHYGLPSEVESGPSQDLRLKRFPFTGRSPEGGCAIEPNAPKTMEVSVCPECVAAEQQWSKRHPKRS